MRVLFLCTVLALAEIAEVFSVSSALRASNSNALDRVDGAREMQLRDDDGGYHYMPNMKALICICAKCGSTSLYEFIYAETFDKPWNFSGVPYIHDVVSSRWEGAFSVLSPAEAAKVLDDDGAFSFALMRDPKVRIISSWKSKVACDGTGNWGTDRRDRARMVPRLMRLAEKPDAECLNFEDFVDTLAIVHRKGLAAQLNVHFRPQQDGCFREFGPSQWSKVGAISDAAAASDLAEHFRRVRGVLELDTEVKTDFPHQHSSLPSSTLNISQRAEKLLNEITDEEYAVLDTRHF